jgi:hypothetical protein
MVKNELLCYFSYKILNQDICMMSVTVKPLMHVHEEVMSFNVNVDEKIME